MKRNLKRSRRRRKSRKKPPRKAKNRRKLKKQRIRKLAKRKNGRKSLVQAKVVTTVATPMHRMSKMFGLRKMPMDTSKNQEQLVVQGPKGGMTKMKEQMMIQWLGLQFEIHLDCHIKILVMLCYRVKVQLW